MNNQINIGDVVEMKPGNEGKCPVCGAIYTNYVDLDYICEEGHSFSYDDLNDEVIRTSDQKTLSQKPTHPMRCDGVETYVK